jgi:penicillin-binding protein A
LVYSCNSVFAYIGNKITPRGWEDGIAGLKLNKPYNTIGLSFTPMLFPAFADLNDLERAQVGIGQGKLLVTPLGMALLTEIIANRGWLNPPYLVANIKDAAKTYTPEPPEKLMVMNRDDAEFIRRVMVQVVQRGTGRQASLEGIDVAGKTGTAENPKGDPHSWFIGFAPANEPKAVVVVLVENAGFGGTVAAPIAAKILEAVLGIK